MQSATNVQLCDPKFLISYLLKYAAGQDEKPKVVIKENADSTANVKVLEHENTKISSQKYSKKKRVRRRI